MKRLESAESVDLHQFTVAMIAAAAELGIVRSFQPPLRPVRVKVVAKAPQAVRNLGWL